MTVIRGLLGPLAPLVAVLVLAPACSSSNEAAPDAAPLVVPEGCQPLLVEPGEPPTTGVCLAPYPSDFHRVADAQSATGFRVGLRGAARPKMGNGVDADLHDVVAQDGASLVPTIVAGFAGDVVHDGLPGVLDDPMLSALPRSGTVILDTTTGLFVPHYTDIVDRRDGAHTPVSLRPFAPLKARTRYVVGISGARLAPAEGATTSELVPPPEGFRRLRNGTAGSDAALAPLAARYDADVFSPLARAGVELEHLQLAWDFTTGSSEQPLADMLRVRELTLASLAANPPQVRVKTMREGTGNLARIVTLEVTAPLFLDRPDPGGRLVHDAGGQVVQNGMTTFDLVAVVPVAVRDRTEPGRALAFGHGFFGGTEELEGDGGRTIAERLGAVLFGIDWWGMAESDFGVVSETLTTRTEHVTDFAERVHQAMANWLVALAAIRGPLTKLPELARASSVAGAPVQPFWDPSFVGYFGASQGHILGGTLAALADFSRVVLNVGGGGFTHIMPRSLNFGPFALLLGSVFSEPLVVQSYAAMMQRSLDRIDPVSYAPLVFASPLPGSAPDRRVLMQIGLGDAQVPNVGSFLHARALGIAQATPSPVAVFGLAPAADADATSSLTIFDYQVDTSGYAEGKPISPNVVHGSVRLNPAALRQMEAFMKPGGAIVHACDGACDPE